MIPKLCHFIWTHGSAMSELQTLSVISFHRHNPYWKIIVHLIKQTQEELPKNIWVPDYTGDDYFHIIESLKYVEIRKVDLVKEGIGINKHSIQASDMLRFRVLYKKGGVYSDFDTLWLRSMNEFKNISCYGDPLNFETTVCYYGFTIGHHNESNIVSEPGGNYLHGLIEEQNEIKPPFDDYQTFLSSLLNNKYPRYVLLKDKYPRVMAIQYKTFYPYSIFNLAQLYQQNDLSPIDSEVMAIHWFNGHELSKDYVNNHGFERDCSMTTILKQEGYL
jgi:hypothetical protein